MRARYPDAAGFVERGGVKVGFEVFGEGDPAVVFAPTHPIVHSHAWKAQVPCLARRFRVITIDPRGNGRSDRPQAAAAYADTEFVADTLAVMDACQVERAVVVGISASGWTALLTAALHPGRVLGVVAIASFVPQLMPWPAERTVHDFDAVLATEEGWAKENRHYWLRDWRGYAEFFFGELFCEPHSSKLREDCVGWAMETSPETVLACEDAPSVSSSREDTERLLRQVRCPVLAIHGDKDRCVPLSWSERLAELTGADLLVVEGAGHCPNGREPVLVNHAIRDFADRIGSGPASPRRWTRPLDRDRRVLYLSSPIGLGHARRDAAIAAELRALRPDVQLDWLAQHPVTALLAARGETVHPASRLLASESAHWESEADEHDLHAFQSLRRMDEILVANFMVFADIVEREHYDLWVGDESWEVDYFLHENPELKRAPYVWMTDFVGLLPMPDGGDAESALTADYNAEMIEQIARFPRVRDRALFVGDPQDVVPGRFGASLPAIREWTDEHYDFTGYITGFDPAEIADREALRAGFGWAPDERVCLVTVGGTGVGEHLLRRAIAAFPLAAARVPGFRMIVVTGPRIDPRSLPAVPGLECHAYLPDLHRQLAACDLAVVQGGLTTTMELAAAGRPFIYVPLRHHFEQQMHVPHRLARYGAGRRMEYEDTTPEHLAAAIAEEISRTVSYVPVENGGAARAAAYLAELL